MISTLSRGNIGSAMLDRVLSCSTSTAVAGLGGAKGGCGWALLVECLLVVVEASVIRWLSKCDLVADEQQRQTYPRCSSAGSVCLSI